MQAIRETLDVIDSTVTIRLPATFAARRVEVIVLPALEPGGTARQPGPRHQPAPELAGTLIHDDLIAPVASAEDWDALK